MQKDKIRFEMARYDEKYIVYKDLEEEFKGLRYKECSGLNDYGKVTSNYTETFPESNEAHVHVSAQPSHEQTTIKLTLLFFEGSGEALSSKDDSAYHDFLKFITGSKIIYRDNVRCRKALMLLDGEPTKPKTDTLYGQKYKEVTFTFKNVYGMTFGYDENFPTE